MSPTEDVITDAALSFAAPAKSKVSIPITSRKLLQKPTRRMPCPSLKKKT
jgi:hypothetical protein